MVNITMLDDEMKAQNITNSEMASACHMDESTWHRKKKEPSKFTIGDIDNMKSKLNLSDEKSITIFLN